MTHGFIFAVTGPDYTGLARQAAATVAHHHPDIPIDLFTDQPCDDPVFARVHQLSESGPRPKFEALLRSRFDRALYLDAGIDGPLTRRDAARERAARRLKSRLERRPSKREFPSGD